MSTTKVYDADQVSIIIGLIPIDGGFAEDSMIKIARKPGFTQVMGVRGSWTRSKTNDNSATVTLSLMQSSEANAILSTLFNLDTGAPNGAGIVPFLVKDRQGTSLYTATECWISTPPDAEFAQGAKEREWVIFVPNLQAFDGGN